MNAGNRELAQADVSQPAVSQEVDGSRVAALKLKSEVCRAFLSESNLNSSLTRCGDAIARSLRASHVTLRVLASPQPPVEVAVEHQNTGSLLTSSALPMSFNFSIPISEDEPTDSQVTVSGTSPHPPRWITPQILEPFLDVVVSEIAYCIQKTQSPSRPAVPSRHAHAVERSRFVGIAGVDEQMRFTKWTAGAHAIFGWTPEEVVGQDIATVLGESAAFQLHETIKLARCGRHPNPVQFTTRRRNGNHVAIAAESIPSPVAEGTADIALILRDVSRERELQTLISMNYAASETATTEFAAELILRDICSAMGWPRGEFWQLDELQNVIASQSWTHPEFNCELLDAVTIPQDKHADNALLELAATRVEVCHVTDFTTKFEDTRTSAAAKCGLHDAIGVPLVNDGRTIGVLLFFAFSIPEPDEATSQTLNAIAGRLTLLLQIEQLQRELKEAGLNESQSQKMEAIGRLAGGIAHDFNNILAIILGYSEIVMDMLDEESPQRPMIKEVESAGHRAADLTKQLLTFSRKQPTSTTVLDVNRRIGEFRGMLDRLVGGRIDLKFDFAEDTHPVKFDAIQFEQIVLNFVVNARDAIADTGTISVRTRNHSVSASAARSDSYSRAGDFVVVGVTDTGFGMDEQTQSRIFEPFFTTKDVGSGTGMGLSTVYGIVHEAGGFLRIQSAPGQGTTLEAYLPRTFERPETLTIDQRPLESQRGDETILLVDDDDTLRTLTARMLEARGYQVITASDGPQALQLLKRRRGRPDLVISDVMMPGLSGTELVRSIQASRFRIPVLLLSGYISPDVADDKLLTETPLLRKPFTSHALGTEVRRILDEFSNYQ